MEELGFHRKYRPKTLKEYVGNKDLKKYARKLREDKDNVDCFITVCEVVLLVTAIFLIAIIS